MGARACRVDSVDDSAISCVVGPGPAGAADVAVRLLPAGFAAGNASVMRDFSVTAISPQIGSAAGEVFYDCRSHQMLLYCNAVAR